MTKVELALQNATSTGALTGATAGLMGGELWQVFIVGAVGAVIGWLKRYDHASFKAAPAKYIMAVPFALAVPMALTATVYYGGTDCINRCMWDFGTMFWMFAAFLLALYYDAVIPAIAGAVPGILSKFGIEIKKKTEPMSDYAEEETDV